MRDTVSPLPRVNLSSAEFLQHCAGRALEADCPRADVRRLSLSLQIEATAARRVAFMSGRRD